MPNDLKTALLDLAQAPDKRSTTARVSEHFVEIETALHSGVSRTTILETLTHHGITLSLKNFDNVLYRLRKKQAAKKPENNTAPLQDISSVQTVQKFARPTSGSRDNPTSPFHAKSASLTLPDDWMTAKLTPEQFRLLSPKQSKAKIDAETAQYFPNRFKPT